MRGLLSHGAAILASMTNLRSKLVTFAAVGAAALGGAALAGAATNGSSSSSSSSTTPSGNQPPAQHQFDPSKCGHTANGKTEKLLSGDVAARVKAAALAKVSGTVERVETDSDGSPYEAHVTKSDGTEVVVKVDKSFNVTDVEAGPTHP